MIDPTRRYRINAVDFPKNPLQKRWSRNQIARHGDGTPIYAPCWELDLTYGTLFSVDEREYFVELFRQGGSFTGILPHPNNGDLWLFQNVFIIDVSGNFTDVANNRYTENFSMKLRVCNITDSTFVGT